MCINLDMERMGRIPASLYYMDEVKGRRNLCVFSVRGRMYKYRHGYIRVLCDYILGLPYVTGAGPNIRGG